MLLRNGDIAVLQFNLDDSYIEVLNNQFLPFELKDYVKTTNFSSMGSIQDSVRYLETFKDFLANRTLNPSRDNAKAILNSVNLPQSMKTAERIQITLACNALTMTDNFWVTDENDTRTFQEVNLRNNHLKDAAYAIAVLGVNASATKEIMEPDISTNGMFPKTWYRDSSGIELWKTDSVVI